MRILCAIPITHTKTSYCSKLTQFSIYFCAPYFSILDLELYTYRLILISNFDRSFYLCLIHGRHIDIFHSFVLKFSAI